MFGLAREGAFAHPKRERSGCEDNEGGALDAASGRGAGSGIAGVVDGENFGIEVPHRI